MSSFQSILLIIFGVIVYMMAVDENVVTFINLLSNIVRTEIEKKIWIIKYHPNNPITNLIKRREYDRIATELMKDLDSQK